MPEARRTEPIYLGLDAALELYSLIVGGTVGQANDQLRDRAGLESALGRPAAFCALRGS